jgi:hypothetical protein
LVSLNGEFGLFVELFVKNAWNFRIINICLAYNSAPARNELLLQKVGVFSNLEVLGQKLSLHQSQPELFGKPKQSGQLFLVSCFVDCLLYENDFNELVVMFE